MNFITYVHITKHVFNVFKFLISENTSIRLYGGKSYFEETCHNK